MPTPLTREDLTAALADLPTKKDLATTLSDFPTRRDLNDRFAHWDNKHEQRHTEIMNQLTTLAAQIDRSDAFDHLAGYLAHRFKVPVEELTGALRS